jgi:hypothetical protein
MAGKKTATICKYLRVQHANHSGFQPCFAQFPDDIGRFRCGTSDASVTTLKGTHGILSFIGGDLQWRVMIKVFSLTVVDHMLLGGY